MLILNEYPPMTAGGACYLCKCDLRKESPTREGAPHEMAIDTGLSIDYEGALVICESCVIEMAALLGLKHPRVVEAAVFERDMANAYAENYMRDLADAQEGLRAMARVLLPEPLAESVVEPVKRGPGRPKASA